jgi:hypothetical protein
MLVGGMVVIASDAVTRLLDARPWLKRQPRSHSQSRPHGRRLVSVAAIAAMGGIGLAGCGRTTRTASSPASARQAVTSAVSALGHQSRLGLRISFGSSKALFVDLETGKGEALDSPQAVTDAADSLDVGIQSGSTTTAELRFVGGALYARLDAAKLPGGASGLATRLGQLNGYVPGLSALADGQWVEASAASIHQLFSQIEQFASQMGVAPPPVAGTVETILTQVYNDVTGAVEANSTYRDLGSSAGKTEYAVTIDVRGFLDQLGPKLRSDLGMLPFGLGSLAGNAVTKAASKVPAGQKTTVDVYVAAGALQEVDASGFRAVFSTPPPVTAPAGATQLDLSKLPAVLRQLGGSHAAPGGAL